MPLSWDHLSETVIYHNDERLTACYLGYTQLDEYGNFAFSHPVLRAAYE